VKVPMKKLPPKPPVDFECAPYELDFGLGFSRFRIGTCEGLWRSTKTAYEILAVANSHPGNGHFQYVLDWFERSAIRDNQKVRFCELMNKGLAKKLSRLGYVINGDNAEKTFLANNREG